ncbi:hypothetical protein [Kingella oralis]
MPHKTIHIRQPENGKYRFQAACAFGATYNANLSIPYQRAGCPASKAA